MKTAMNAHLERCILTQAHTVLHPITVEHGYPRVRIQRTLGSLQRSLKDLDL